MSKYGYRSVSVSPLEFEITGVDCSKVDLLKFYYKYGKKLSCPNIQGEYGIVLDNFFNIVITQSIWTDKSEQTA